MQSPRPQSPHSIAVHPVPAPTAAAAVAAIVLAAASAPAWADDEALRREFDEKMKQALDAMERRHREEMDRLRTELDASRSAPPSALQEQIDRLGDSVDDLRAKLPAAAPRIGGFRLIDLSLNGLFAAGASSGTEDEVQELQQGGHDPQKRGFTVQNVELIMTGAVDAYFTAQTNLIFQIDAEGETKVELEEAFATTSSLPAGFQVRAGQFFTQFGRHNAQHPHQWDFVDAPIANARILGPDGLRGPGAQVSWLGAEIPIELTAAVQNANGETAVSFLGTEEEEPPAGSHVERTVESLSDLVWTGRAALSMDASDEIPVLVGASYAYGPSGAAFDGSSRVFGADVTAKWKPLDAEAGFPFVTFRAEWIHRDYEFDDAGATDELSDGGWTAQAVWGFTRNWTAALRYETFDGDFGGDTPGLDDRTRWSAALTFHTSEFAKLRLQVNHDDADALDGDVTSVWLQLEFNLGQHGAHKF